MFKEVTAFLEKLPVFITRTGFLLAVAGGVFDACLRYNFLAADAAFGWIAALARPTWILGLSLIAVAIIWELGRVLYGLRGVPLKIASTRARKAKLLSNIRLLDNNSAVILLALLERPMPRFDPNGTTRSLEKLYRLGLIESDNKSAWLVNPFMDVMVVANPIWKQRAAIIESLNQSVRLGGRAAQDVADAVLRSEGGRI